MIYCPESLIVLRIVLSLSTIPPLHRFQVCIYMKLVCATSSITNAVLSVAVNPTATPMLIFCSLV